MSNENASLVPGTLFLFGILAISGGLGALFPVGGAWAATYEETIMGLNPDFRWVLDGDFTDEMGNLDGTLGNAPTYVSTIIPQSEHSQCGDFTPNDEMHVADSPLINYGTGYAGQERSISVWFMADSVPTNTGNIIWGEGGATNSLSVYTYNDGGTYKAYCTAVEGKKIDYAEYAISTGTLYHLGCTYDFPNNAIKMYINGALVDTDSSLAIGASLSSHSANNALGGQDSNTDNHLGSQISTNFNGKIADFAYWSDGAVLEASDFAAIYETGMYGGGQQSEIAWSASSLDLGSGTEGAGSLTGSAGITSSGTSSNVEVSCDSGDCATISEDWVDTTDMEDEQEFFANFTCSDSSAGNFSATFSVASDEDASADEITVTCYIEPAQQGSPPTAPVTENVVLESFLGTNTSAENLTLSYDSYDVNEDAVKNITSWFLDSEPLMLLNLPFESQSTSSS
ncbi:hypothetical protein JW721_03485, partial [Candidatus Micrarchaeota archaeon]|nr:hypothetical protein [Candidatus Micrarchaeota archaeon]